MKKFFVVAMMAVAFTGAVQAQSMFRCTKAGVSSYQDTPCDDMVVERPVQGNIVSGLPTPCNAQNVTKLDPSTNKAMTEAYQNHMARGEYATARTFAVNDAQRAQANMQLARLQTRCQTMAIRTNQAEANNRHMNGRWQHAAEAAQAQYSVTCGQATQ